MTRRRPLNRKNILGNIAEAIEELQNLEKKAADGTLLEEQFQVRLLHVYHHLNFAWNTRRVSSSEISQRMKEQFESWGKYPAADIENL